MFESKANPLFLLFLLFLISFIVSIGMNDICYNDNKIGVMKLVKPDNSRFVQFYN